MWKVLGIMSGSSLDGLDFCYFEMDFGTWNYEIKYARTIPYPEDILGILKILNSENYFEIDALYSHFLGAVIKEECRRNGIFPDVVGIHGHTFLHNPRKGFSVQLGKGEIIKTYLDFPVITDFRTRDIALGGEGAPLVPFGEWFLFPEYDLFLNLGGIANFSFLSKRPKKVLASDICPFNQVLNFLAKELGVPYDAGGNLAKKGKFLPELNEKLSRWEFYSRPVPKSLSNREVQEFIRSKIIDFKANTKDKLHTLTKHFAEQIAKVLEKFPAKKVLITGGGAYNDFFIELLRERLPFYEPVIPAKEIVEFKESLIFGFLGLRKLLGLKNVFGVGSGQISSSGSLSL